MPRILPSPGRGPVARAGRESRARSRHQPSRTCRTVSGSAAATSPARSGPPPRREGRGRAVQPGADAGRVVRRQAGGEQGAGDPAEDVARPGGGQPRHAGGGDADPAVGVGGERTAALEHDDRVVAGRRGAGVVEAAGLDVGAVDAAHRGQLARVGGQHGRDAERSRDVPQRVGVDDDRDAVGDRGRERLPCRVAAAGADGPRLHPALADDLGVHPADDVGDLADVADHPRQPAVGAADAEQRGAGVGGRAGADADDAARVLVTVAGRLRQQPSYVGGLQRLDGWRGQVEAEVDEVDRPARGRGGVDEVADLERAEGDGERGRHVGAARARRCRPRFRSGRRRRRPGRRRPGRAPPPRRVAARGGRRCRRSRRRRRRAGSRRRRRRRAAPRPSRRRPAARSGRPRGPRRPAATPRPHSRAGRASRRRTARRRRCRRTRPAAAPAGRTRRRAGRAPRAPAPRQPAASAHPPAARPSGPPRPPAPARPCAPLASPHPIRGVCLRVRWSARVGTRGDGGLWRADPDARGTGHARRRGPRGTRRAPARTGRPPPAAGART